MKRCISCKKTKHNSDFYKDNTKRSGLCTYCKPCQNQKDRSRFRKDRYSRFGITEEHYDIMLQKQGGVCGICGKPETAKGVHGGVKLPAIDHCHKTGKVRGILCGRCNTALGLFDDNIDALESAIRYLRE